MVNDTRQRNVATRFVCGWTFDFITNVYLSLTAFTHYCTDPDISWENGRGCHLVVHYWAGLQSVHGFRCYDSIAPNAKCQRVLRSVSGYKFTVESEVWWDCFARNLLPLLSLLVKEFENRSAFGKVGGKSRLTPFFRARCILGLVHFACHTFCAACCEPRVSLLTLLKCCASVG